MVSFFAKKCTCRYILIRWGFFANARGAVDKQLTLTQHCTPPAPVL